jgi:hypothetical protein
MNPFFFKSHALLASTLALLTGSGSLGLVDALLMAAIYLAAALAYGWCLAAAAKKAVGLALPYRKAYLLGVPATLGYLPLGVTLLSDIVHQSFQLDDRYVFLFAIAVVTLMLAGLYGVVLHYRGGQPIGSESGLTLALALLLVTLPIALVLLGFDAWLGFVPRPRLSDMGG